MKGFNFDGYKLIAQCREKDLVEWLGRQIPKVYGEKNCVVNKQYIFAKGKLPVILCAHMDTVFDGPPETIVYDRKQELIMSPQGIGGDDRNGVYSVLTLISRFKDCLPYVLFTTQEEHGCIGAKAAAKPLTEKVKGVRFAVQIDRKGTDDAVFYNCVNDEFTEYICSFGYKETPGLSTDICYLCPEWGIAGVNFSCGYLYNHNKEELVNVKDMFKTIDMVEKILKDVKAKPDQGPFKYMVRESVSYFNVQSALKPIERKNKKSNKNGTVVKCSTINGKVLPKPKNVIDAIELC